MNSRAGRAVEPAVRHVVKVTQIAALLGVLGWPACIQIDGGAVELSWSLRDLDGNSVGSCADAHLAEVELCWEPLSDAGAVEPGGACPSGMHKSFACKEANGVTAFNIAPGPTALWIQPICNDGQPADPTTYQVPPPIVRTVEDGKIVTLNSLLVVVGLEGSGHCGTGGCTCVR